VNTTERQAIRQGAELYDEVRGLVDDRTLEIVDRRWKTAVVRRRGWLVRRALLLADLVGLLLAFFIAQWLFGTHMAAVDRIGPDTEWTLFLLSLPGWVLAARLYGLYERDEERTDHSTVDDVVGVFHLVTVGAWLFLAGAWLTDVADPRITKLITFWLLAVLFVTTGRATARALARRSIAYQQNTIIVGAGDVGQTVARKLLNHPEYGINLVGFVDDEPKERRDDLGHLTLLGSPSRLPGLIRVFDVERVIIAFSNDSHEQTLELIRSLKDLDVQIDIVPRLYEMVGPSVGIHTVEGLPLIGLPPLGLSRSSQLLKRMMDLACSAVGLIVLAPVFALIAMLIKLDSPGPVFFRQVRMGKGDRTFRMWKFRTMTADADERKAEVAHLNRHAKNGDDGCMFKVPNDPRTTRFGRFLRRHSLDELPQLINVVKGEMSLVGPRPLILDEDQHVQEWARKRLDLKPGITGLWQSLGRSEIPFEEMVRFDYLYVTTWSMWNDARLLLRTIPLVVRGGGGNC
jgi:exopolysaccharide biosynthesis polyprenyl glycosylphosphotransferase